MVTLISFIVLVLIAAVLNRSMAWGKRALAEHRQRFFAMGYRERNRSRRLREEKYNRVFLMAYVAIGALAILLAPAPQGHGRHPNPLMSMAIAAFVMVSSFAPAVVVRYIVKTVTEWKHPIGDRALKMRDEELVLIPSKLAAAGEHGTSRKVSPQDIGLTISSGESDKKRKAIVLEDEAVSR